MVNLIRRRPKATPTNAVLCGRRFDGYPVPLWPADLEQARGQHRGRFAPPDRWNHGGGIVGQEHVGRSCSHCGSLHPATLLEKLDAGWILEGSDKRYKWYLSRPFTEEERATRSRLSQAVEEDFARAGRAVGRTVAKFYTPHLTREQCERIVSMLEDKTLNHSLYVTPWLPAMHEAAPEWLVTGVVA